MSERRELMLVPDKSTYIKIDRNLLNWRWFKSPKTLAVWIWLLLKANTTPQDFRKETIQRGERATSRKSISEDTGLTEREVRTALEHLKSTGEVSVRYGSDYQVISILRYDYYQGNESGNASGSGPAKVRQKSGRRPQYKNDNNEKNEKNEKNSSGDTTTTIRVPPSREEVTAYCFEHGIQTDVDAFMSFNASRGWKRGKMKVEDWRPLLAQWVSKDNEYRQTGNDDELDDFGRPIREEFK